jgi:hypothetical protein
MVPSCSERFTASLQELVSKFGGDKAQQDRMEARVRRMLELKKRKHAVAALYERRPFQEGKNGGHGSTGLTALSLSKGRPPLQIDRVEREIAGAEEEIDEVVYDLPAAGMALRNNGRRAGEFSPRRQSWESKAKSQIH